MEGVLPAAILAERGLGCSLNGGARRRERRKIHRRFAGYDPSG